MKTQTVLTINNVKKNLCIVEVRELKPESKEYEFFFKSQFFTRGYGLSLFDNSSTDLSDFIEWQNFINCATFTFFIRALPAQFGKVRKDNEFYIG